MTPEPSHREELEARLTALLLGELAPDEAASLREAIAHDPELARLYDQLKRTLELVRETIVSPEDSMLASPEPLRLSDARREKLLDSFKVLRPREFTKRPAVNWREWGSLAAMVTGLAGVATALTLQRNGGASGEDSEPGDLRFWYFSEKRSPKNITALPAMAGEAGNIHNPAELGFETGLRAGSGVTGLAPAQPATHGVPNFGDVPLLGRLFKSEKQVAGASLPSSGSDASREMNGRLIPPPPSAPVDLSMDLASPAPKDSKSISRELSARRPASVDLNYIGDDKVQRGTDRYKRSASLPESHFDAPSATAERIPGEVVLPQLAPAAEPSVRTLTEVEFGRESKESPPKVDGTLGGVPGGAGFGGGGRLAGGIEWDAKGIGDGRAFVYGLGNAALPGGLVGGASAVGDRSGVARSADYQGAKPEAFGADSPVAINGPAGPITPLYRDVPWDFGDAIAAPATPPPAAKPAGTIASNGLLSDQTKSAGAPVSAAGAVVQLHAALAAPAPETLAKLSTGTEADTKRSRALDSLSARLPESLAVMDSETRLGLPTVPVPAPRKDAANADSFTFTANDSAGIDQGPRGFVNGAVVALGAGLVREGSQVQAGRDIRDGAFETGLKSQMKALEPGNNRLVNRFAIILPGQQEERGRGESLQRESKVQTGPITAGEISSRPELAQVDKLAKLTDDGRQVLQRDVEARSRVLQAMGQGLEQERINGQIAKKSPVAMVDKALAENAPAPTFWGRIGGVFDPDAPMQRTARLKIGKETGDVTAFSDALGDSGFDPYFLNTEFEVIKSHQVIDRVVDKLDLKNKWAEQNGGVPLSTEQAYKLVARKIEVGADPKTGIVDIKGKGRTAEESALLANTVAGVYSEVTDESRQHRYRVGLDTLGKQLTELNVELTADKDKLAASGTVAGKNPNVSTIQSRLAESDSDQPDLNRPKPAPAAAVPQPDITASENPFSTFSLNVSDVSFKLAAASLDKDQMPDPATVRSEEFVNAFDYRDPEPQGAAPIAFAWERARYPFAQDRDLVRFSIKTAATGRQPGRPLNLVLLLDNSGSMERADRVAIIQECLRVLAGQLQPQDTVSVVAFARTARLWVDGLPGNQAGELAERVGSLTPQGGTNLEDAMTVAYQTAVRHFLPNGVNRVVLLTDGAANLGDVEPESLRKKVETQRKQGIALDCFGIGWEGYNDDLLESLSRNGDGRYGFVNSPEAATTEFAGQLAGALNVAASDVKVQVEFNPRRATAYRQIGYAKHQLTKEQFRDNTVDAAEIGAAEAGNALYVVQVNPSGEGPIATVRVRFKVPGTQDYREMEWAVPYEGPAKPLEQAAPSLRLAGSASAFSEWLVASPYASEVTTERLLSYLRGVPESCPTDPRPKQLENMIRQAKRLAGK